MPVDLAHFRITPGEPADLASRPTRDHGGFEKSDGKKEVDANLKRMRRLQERLYAESKQSLLLVLQAMDTAGKDSTIRRVIGPLNPQGVRVWNFKAPTPAELAHDFLWRVHKRMPGDGYIGVFNRSHYEDVLVARVRRLVPLAVVERRYGHINDFEQLVHDEGTRVIKVMLHISKDYQARRLRRRLKREEKHWKFDPGDLDDRARWDDYQQAYELALTRCSTEQAPWYVVPAERRWFRDLVISQLLVETLERMDPQFPPPDFDPDDYPTSAIE